MQTLLEKLSAQLDSVRAIEPERISNISPKYRPQRQALDEGLKVYVGPKGGRYRINKNGRKVYIIIVSSRCSNDQLLTEDNVVKATHQCCKQCLLSMQTIFSLIKDGWQHSITPGLISPRWPADTQNDRVRRRLIH